MSDRKYSFSKIFSLVRQHKADVSAIYFYSIINGIIQITIPLGIQAILGYVIGATVVASVVVLIVAIILGVILSGFLQILQMKIIERIKQKIFVSYSLQIAESIPNIDIKSYDSVYLPEKINYYQEIGNIQKGLSKLLLDVPISLISLVAGLIIISFYHVFFIAMAILLIIVIMLLFRMTAAEGIKSSIEESDRKYKAQSWLEEMGRTIRQFKFTQGTHLNLQRMDADTVHYLEAKQRHFSVLLTQYNFLVTFKVCLTAIMLILGSYLLFNQMINLGQFVAAELIIFLIISAVEKLIISLDSVYDINTGIIKLDILLDLQKEPSGTIRLHDEDIDIELQGLTIYNQGNKLIIDNLHAHLPSRNINCIIGKENTGKSLLLSALSGLKDDYQGEILWNKISMRHISKDYIRSSIGTYFDDNAIFSGSVLENITMGKSFIQESDVIRLIEKLKFGMLLTLLPEGLHTRLAPLGLKLPKSAINKILLLRALIHAPKVLILEKPFAYISADSIQNLIQYLYEIQSGTNIIIINHQEIPQLRAHNKIYL